MWEQNRDQDQSHYQYCAETATSVRINMGPGSHWEYCTTLQKFPCKITRQGAEWFGKPFTKFLVPFKFPHKLQCEGSTWYTVGQYSWPRSHWSSVWISHKGRFTPSASINAYDSVLIENSGVPWKWVANPFWRDSIVFNENRITSVIAALTLTLSINGP